MSLTSHVDGKLGNLIVGEDGGKRREALAGVRLIVVASEAGYVDDKEARGPGHGDDVDAMLVAVRIPFKIDRQVFNIGEL